jgi:hypothetical protein
VHEDAAIAPAMVPRWRKIQLECGKGLTDSMQTAKDTQNAAVKLTCQQ